MMKTVALFALIALALFLPACQQVGDHFKSHMHDHSTTTAAADAGAAPLAVKLDNGAKWKANPETIQGVRSLRESVGLFVPSRAHTEEWKAFSDILGRGFNDILSKCTMTGEAHEQLHSWLMPLEGYIAAIAKGPGTEADDAYLKMSAHLKTFDTYFE